MLNYTIRSDHGTLGSGSAAIENCTVLALQVALNQLALAPVTLAAVFTWNSVLTGQSEAIPGKIQRDLVPSMLNGEGLL